MTKEKIVLFFRFQFLFELLVLLMLAKDHNNYFLVSWLSPLGVVRQTLAENLMLSKL